MPTNTTPSNTRIFDPTEYFLGPPERVRSLEQASDIIHHISSYDAQTGITHLAVNNLKAKRRADRTLKIDRNSILVAIDGVFRDGKAAYGAWFGRNSRLNINSLVPPNSKNQSRDLALLLGTGEALKRSYEHLFLVSSPSITSSYSEIIEEKYEKKTVVVITDSPYLVKCMSDWVLVWQNRGFQNLKGEFVGNHLDIKNLGDVCLEIERIGGEVRFWLVEKGGVEDARRLAEKVLDGKEG
jgi:hypothetical protein